MVMRVGIVAQNIRQSRPRGVARVARAFVEQLAQRDDLACFVISGPTYSLGSIMVNHFGLVDYLAHVPLDLTSYALQSKTWVDRLGFARPIISKLLGRKFGGIDLGAVEGQCKALGPVPLSYFDVVVSFEAFEELWDWPIEMLPTKFVGLLHDTIPMRIDEGPNGRPDHFYRCAGKFVARADHVFCNSACTERDAHIFFPLSRGKTSTILLGHVPPAAPVASHRGSDDELRIVMLGDMDLRKNVQGAMRALQLIREKARNRRVVLEIIGNTGQRSHFAVFEADACRFAEIRWLGYLPDAERSERLAAADVFLFPSLWEGFGIPILEAMHCGVPVVCSNLSSMPEVGGHHAFYIDDPYDPQSIADAVLKAIAMSPQERTERVAGAREWAAQFTWQRAAGQLADLIKTVAAQPKRATEI